MNIFATAYIPFPRPLVYETYRDKLIEVAPYLENVQAIRIKSRCYFNELTHIVSKWQGNAEIPLVLTNLIDETILSWTDIATWNHTEFTTKWRIKTDAFTEAVRCVGINRFFEVDNGTLVECRGELKIDSREINGIPSFLSDTIKQAIENLLSKNIEPNFLQISEGACMYLKENQKHYKEGTGNRQQKGTSCFLVCAK